MYFCDFVANVAYFSALFFALAGAGLGAFVGCSLLPIAIAGEVPAPVSRRMGK